jgi:hypothetical protein
MRQYVNQGCCARVVESRKEESASRNSGQAEIQMSNPLAQALEVAQNLGNESHCVLLMGDVTVEIVL